MWKFKSLKGKDKWIFLLTIGIILCILAFPAENLANRSKTKNPADANRSGTDSAGMGTGNAGMGTDRVGIGIGSTGMGDSLRQENAGEIGMESGQGEGLPLSENTSGDGTVPAASARAETSYEAQLEQRIREILKHVDGVGNVDVMVVLKSSAEKVIHVDDNTSFSTTDETDSSGGKRRIESQEQGSSTVMTSQDGQSLPIIEKEMYPELSGIVISASGGGNPGVQAEISAAMEALFGLPANKIKVLKRVE